MSAPSVGNALLTIFLSIGLLTLLILLLHDPLVAILESLINTPEVTVTAKSPPTRCVYCHDNSCDFKCRCGASYHRECWNDMTKCGTLGCRMTSADTRRRIEKKAFDLFCESGKQHGRDQEHWIAAERKILSGTI